MEIRIRAWCKKGDILIPENSMYYNVGITPNYVVVDDTGHEDEWNFGEKENFELMLWTGLQDSGKKDIYEGDIIRVWFHDNVYYDHEVYYGIKYDYPAFDLRPSMCDDCNSLQAIIIDSCNDIERIEVIGNIYENPELSQDARN